MTTSGNLADVVAALAVGMFSATNAAGVGFYFEEGGCWGMALALQEVITLSGGDAELVYFASMGHAVVWHDGIYLDHSGGLHFRANQEGISFRCPKKFLDFACATSGWDAGKIEADRTLAKDIVANALDDGQSLQPTVGL